MEAIDDHTEMLSLMICKMVRSYMTENPGMVHSEVLQALFSCSYAVAASIDEWYSEIETLVGTRITEAVECSDFTEFLHFSNDLQENLENTEYEDEEDEDDEEDD